MNIQLRRSSAPPLATSASAILPALAVIAACSSGISPTGEYDLETIPRVELREMLKIGSADNPDISFTAVGGTDVDAAGNLYAYDNPSYEIRVFDKTGRLLRTIGRRGEGPGEFTDSPRFGIKGDTLWAMHGRRSSGMKLVLFDLAGAVMSTGSLDGVRVPLQPPRGVGVVMPIGMAPDGLLYSSLTTYTGARPDELATAGERDTILIPRVRWDITGRLVDTVGWQDFPPPDDDFSSVADWVEIGGKRYYVPSALGDGYLTLPVFDGVVVIDNTPPAAQHAAVRIVKLSLSRDTVYNRNFNFEALPYTPASLDSAAWSSAKVPGGGIPLINGVMVPPPAEKDSLAAFEAIRAEMRFPDFQRPFLQTAVGKDGTIWLSRYDARGGPTRWVILNPDLTPRGEVSVPQGVRLLLREKDYAWTVVRDEFDVQWLVKYDFQVAR